MATFTDRQGTNLNRKKLVIISQAPGEMVVDMERADTATTAGTPINAGVFNAFQTEINTANTNANTAKTNAANAVTTANTANTNANTAKTNAANAVTTANTANTNAQTALNTANAASQAVAATQGTVIKINNVAQSNIAFTTDPQSQINTKLNSNFSALVAKAVPVATDAFPLLESTTAKKITYSSIKSEIVNSIYPIGAIYMSVVATSPATLFGGTWTALTDRFLIGASASKAVNSTGGVATIALTESQMPRHKHTITATTTASQSAHRHTVYSSNLGHSANAVGVRGANAKGLACVEHSSTYGYYADIMNGQSVLESIAPTVDVTVTPQAENCGGSLAHDNMPPYLAVYMWKRVS